MATKYVELKDFSKVLGEFNHLTLEKQKAAVASGLAKSVALLVRMSPVDTGLYAQSWDFSVDEEKAVIGNYAPHAPIIEFGARPFMPPLAPLLAWAKRILKDPSQPPNYSQRVWALARYTQLKISREGMKPRAILQNALPAIIENIKQELREAA